MFLTLGTKRTMCHPLSNATCITFWILLPNLSETRTFLHQNDTLSLPVMTLGICSFSIESIKTSGNCTGDLGSLCKCLELSKGTKHVGFAHGLK